MRPAGPKIGRVKMPELAARIAHPSAHRSAINLQHRCAAVCGALNETLISIRLSLTVGSRCRTIPVSQAPSDGAAAWAALAIRSAGALASSVAAVEALRKSRRSNRIATPLANAVPI